MRIRLALAIYIRYSPSHLCLINREILTQALLSLATIQRLTTYSCNSMTDGKLAAGSIRNGHGTWPVKAVIAALQDCFPNRS